jgi:diaminopimelate decarboxylase
MAVLADLHVGKRASIGAQRPVTPGGVTALAARARATAREVLGRAVRRVVPARRDLPLETFALSRDERGRLALRGVALEPLLSRFGSPLFVADAAALDANVAELARVPGVECAYSYKTNPVPALLQRLHALGVGAEVISEYELWLALRLGVPGDRIVSNGPGRSAAALRAAVAAGALVHVNHREEIAAVAAIARGLGKRGRVGLRVVTPSGWGGQFGEPIAGGDALAGYREMAARPELSIVSLHTHLGVGLHDVADVERLVAELVAFAATLRDELGIRLEYLDFGGSLGSRTVRRFDPLALRLNRAFAADLAAAEPAGALGLSEWAATLARGVDDRCREAGLPRPRVLVEPGRSLTSNAQLLMCRVTGVKSSGARGLPHAILDAGINVAEPLRNEFHQIFVAGPPRGRERLYRLVGPICTPMDTLLWSTRLPELAPGDVLAILDAGAYFVPFSTSFSFPQPGLVLVDRGRTRLVRRKETFEDLVRRDVP